MRRDGASPPALLRHLIAACLPPDDRRHLVADLDILFARRAAGTSRVAATAWYARQAAGFALRFGSLRLTGLPDTVAADFRDAVRGFRQRPGYVLAFVATMAIATGVLATVYTAAWWVLLRPVPGVTAGDRLVTLRIGSSEAPSFVSWSISHPDYLTLRDRLPVGGMLAARTPVDVDVRVAGGSPARIAGEMVTANYFAVAGTRMVAGRGFLVDEDETMAGEPVTVLSVTLARQIAPDPAAVVGTVVTVNGTVVRVVGVADGAFRGLDLPGSAELWFPLSARGVVEPGSTQSSLANRGEPVWRRMVGRMPVGTSLDQVTGAGVATVEAIRGEYRVHSFMALHQALQVFPGVGLDPGVRAVVRRTLAQLGGAAVLLLLLAIANLANLTLIESTRRETSTAIRVALGASRAGIVRGALVESTVLGVASALVAVALAAMLAGWYQGAQLSEHGAALGGMRITTRIIGFSLLTSCLASFVVALRPAMVASRSDGSSLIRRGMTDGRGTHRLRSALVTAQVALSLVLLVAAGLLGRTVANLRAVDLGFDPSRLLTFSIEPHLHGYESARLSALVSDLESGFASGTGVTGAGFISPSPLGSSYLTAALYGSDDPQQRPVIAAGFYASAGLLPALGVRVIAGEDPWRSDSATVVLDRRALAAVYPGMSPDAAIGRLVPTRPGQQGRLRIAAIVDSLRLSDITADPPPVIFRPLGERLTGLSLTGIVRGTTRPGALATAVHRVLAARSPDLPVFNMRTARALVDLQFTERNALARAAATLGAFGLLLAAIGLYGVLASLIAARRRELGVRCALGAAPGAILRRVLSAGLVPVALGIVLGAVGAMGASRVLATQLFQVPSIDPATFLGAASVLVAAALAASLFPAWRATRVSPVEALRED